MYIPDDFRVTDEVELFAFLEEHDFATLITGKDGVPFATHLPLLLDKERRRLLGHVARANPHWHDLDGSCEALAIFSGPHAYVSPTWYATQPAVPTWNYTAVHVYGTPQLITDEREVLDILNKMLRHYEPPENWAKLEGPPGFIEKLSRAIVAFELPIERIEGKFKLSQNRSEVDRLRVMERLEDVPGGSSKVADLMRRLS